MHTPAHIHTHAHEYDTAPTDIVEGFAQTLGRGGESVAWYTIFSNGTVVRVEADGDERVFTGYTSHAVKELTTCLKSREEATKVNEENRRTWERQRVTGHGEEVDRVVGRAYRILRGDGLPRLVGEVHIDEVSGGLWEASWPKESDAIAHITLSPGTPQLAAIVAKRRADYLAPRVVAVVSPAPTTVTRLT